MLVSFTKMHGLGNDFVIVDLISQRFSLQQRHIKKIADRNFGVGCDQLLVVAPPSIAEADFDYKIFNPDGSEAQQCGNGIRCFAKYVRDHQLTRLNTIKIKTSSGVSKVNVLGKNQFKANMGKPIFTPSEIPFKAESQKNEYIVNTSLGDIAIGAVSMGNPHAVLIVDNIQTANVSEIGPILEAHTDFPEKVNAGFMEIVSRDEIKLRVFERGAGETLACGSGACAAVAVGINNGLLNEHVTVTLPNGCLHIEWAGGNHPLMMSGPAENVFEGKINL